MPYRRSVVALLLATTALVSLSACTTGSPSGTASDAVTTAQPDISGEWVLTRTVASSNDVSNPARAVGATSVRSVLIDRDDCDTALCGGTVSSGATVDAREETTLTQTDGGLGYVFTGALDCMNVTTGGVLSVGAFDFSQTATLAIGDVSDVAGKPTASTLTGAISYTDTVTEKAVEAGCTRDPATVTVEYTVTAVRAPVG